MMRKILLVLLILSLCQMPTSVFADSKIETDLIVELYEYPITPEMEE